MSSTRNRPTTAASLTDLANKMLFGTLSETFRTCGKPECVCHKGQRHGPYLHVSYRESGRTRGYYVPAAREQQVREGIAAWQRFQQLALQMAEDNRVAMGLASKGRGKAKERSR
jgi:Family of unknown function (DUF6788)